MTQTLVVAKWDRPLSQLRVNENFFPFEPDELGWERSDGWQCFAPEEFYDTGLLPPVVDIAAETGGPVLGAALEDSSGWGLSWVDAEGRLREACGGGFEEETRNEVYERMTRHWGSPWWNHAADNLAAWGNRHTGASPTELGLWAAIVCSQVFADGTVNDVLAMLGLGDDRNPAPIWPAVPDAEYAVDARQIDHVDLPRPPDRRGTSTDLVVACAPGAFWRVWSMTEQRWLTRGTGDYLRVISELAALTWERGWH